MNDPIFLNRNYLLQVREAAKTPSAEIETGLPPSLLRRISSLTSAEIEQVAKSLPVLGFTLRLDEAAFDRLLDSKMNKPGSGASYTMSVLTR